jgi:hypothetical protein
MTYNIYVKGYKFYYEANKINLADVKWFNEEVIELEKPTECYEEDSYSDPDRCVIDGSIFIPKKQISHIVVYK